MWYVLTCPEGNEAEVLQTCRERIAADVLEKAFVFTWDRMKRYLGSWHVETHLMFPGCVFLEGNKDGRELFRSLEEYQTLFFFMQVEKCAVPVEEKEEKLLRELCGHTFHLGMSKGVIKDGVTHVTEGPLAGKEQMITKIDRHKRLAFLKGEAFPCKGGLMAGLEIVSKN